MSIDVSENTGGTSVLCQQCNSVNAADRKFCGSCGQQLWQRCASCGARSPMGVKFCGQCGRRLEEALVGRLAELDQALAESSRRIADCEFAEAQRSLLALKAAVNADQFPQIAARVAEQLAQLAADRERRQDDARAAYEAAQLYLADRDYDRARCALESVPAPLRDEETDALLARVHDALREIAALELEIRRAIAARETGELRPKVERLLELQPAHEDGQQLAARLREKNRQDDLRLRERLCRSAKESIAQFDYAQAVEQLKLVPTGVRDDDFERLYDYAEELAWLMADLRNAPVVDLPLVEVAQRLVKMQPGNRLAAELLEEMQRRLRGESKDPRQAAPGWARAPNRTPLGMPVEWLGGFGRLEPASREVKRSLAAHPGQFQVAAGLALQALERARVSVSLLPVEKGGLLGRLGQLKRAKAPRSGWGIDVGPTSLKAVKLALNSREEPVIEACLWVEHEKNLSRPDAEDIRGQLIAQSLGKFLEAHRPDLNTERFCVGLSGAKTIGRFFQLPLVKTQKIADAMLFEAQHQIPLPLETLEWDYQVLNAGAFERTEPRVGDMYDCLLLAARKTDVQERLQAFADLEIEVSAVQNDCVAVYNLLSHEFWSEVEGEKEAADQSLSLVIDLGSDATNVLVAGARSLWFRTVGRGGDEFTRRIMREFNLTFDRAEQFKRSPAAARLISKVHQAMLPAFQELENELHLSLSSYTASLPGARGAEECPPSRLLGLGGGFQTHGLLRYLRTGQ